MSAVAVAVTVVVAVIGGVSSLVSLWLVLRFLRHVYDKGGADDLASAASAVRTVRWPVLGRRARRRIGK